MPLRYRNEAANSLKSGPLPFQKQQTSEDLRDYWFDFALFALVLSLALS
jgi:hypothetical protein